MKTTKKKGKFLQKALYEWKKEGVLTPEYEQRLLNNIEILPFDWKRLAKYSFWIAIICIVISVASILADRVLLEMLSKIFDAPDFVKLAFFLIVAIFSYYWGAKRRKMFPSKRLAKG